MKVYIDGVIQELEAENELILDAPISLEEELVEIKEGINALKEMLTPFIKYLGG